MDAQANNHADRHAQTHTHTTLPFYQVSPWQKWVVKVSEELKSEIAMDALLSTLGNGKVQVAP